MTITEADGLVMTLSELSDPGTLTWETAADWDNAVSESGVVHEAVANTDHSDDTIVKQGWSAAAPYLDADLLLYAPMNEDSGSTAYDFSSTGNNGSHNGATLNTAGLLGTTCPDYDGTDDVTNFPDVAAYDTGNTYTVSFWINLDFLPSNLSSVRNITSRDNGGGGVGWFVSFFDSDGGSLRFGTNNGNIQSAKSSWNTGQWYHIVAVQDGSSTAYIYVDAAQEASGDNGFSGQATGEHIAVGDRSTGSNNNFFDGKIAEYRYYGRGLTQSEISNLRETGTTAGTLTTATKSFNVATNPDLTADVTMNGVTDIQVDVIGSPGTGSEEVQTVQVTGDGTYDPAFASDHQEMQLKVYPDNEGDVTRTPTINSLSLA